MSGPTRGQVKRALEWELYRGQPKSKRGAAPGCVTCGEASDWMYSKGEPHYPCRHEPLRVDDATMERARAELAA